MESQNQEHKSKSWRDPQDSVQVTCEFWAVRVHTPCVGGPHLATRRAPSRVSSCQKPYSCTGCYLQKNTIRTGWVGFALVGTSLICVPHHTTQRRASKKTWGDTTLKNSIFFIILFYLLASTKYIYIYIYLYLLYSFSL